MHPRCDREFATLLARHFRVEDLDLHEGSVCGLWSDGRIAYLNRAWDAFAETNGGQPAIRRAWDLGSRYFDAIPEPLLPFYEGLFASVPAPGATLRPASHEYECSSAEVFRRFSMQVFALGDRSGFAIVHSLLVEHPHDARERRPHARAGAAYADAVGVIRQCCHCRRFQNRTKPRRWDWVPAWVDQAPAGVSHTICEVCFGYYYPG